MQKHEDDLTMEMAYQLVNSLQNSGQSRAKSAVALTCSKASDHGHSSRHCCETTIFKRLSDMCERLS